MKFLSWLVEKFMKECNGSVFQLESDLTTLENVEVLLNELFDNKIKEELLFQVKMAKNSIEEREVEC